MIDLKALAGTRFRVRLDESATDETSRVERLWLYQIPCKYGHIGVWGATTLSAWTGSRLLINRLASLEGVKVVQRGDREIQVVFTPDRLEAVANLLHARKRKRLSEEQLAVLRARMAGMRARLPKENASATAPDEPEGGEVG